MLSIIASWLVILGVCISIGAFVVNIFTDGKCLHSIDIYFVLGLMIVNLYAEIFSIFSKVEKNAFLIIVGMAAVCLIYNLYRTRNNLKKIFLNIDNILNSPIKLLKIVICILVCIGMIAYTSDAPWHSDTALYHAQAIRWIEEYGIVKGLGNLHNRLAYNSAFMPLQALFSFKWFCGQSLHTLNGLIAYLLFVYALCTNRLIWKRTFQMTECLKIVAIVYVYHERVYLSSPGTDMLALSLVIYIMIKWAEFYEKEQKETLPYVLLCFLAIWSVTVKLSTAMLVLLCIYPITIWIKNKKWGKLWSFLGGTILIVIPWIMRNILLSGYIVYPYSQIDIINVDWKMPKALVDYDRKEIMVWGRGVCDVTKFDQTFFEWFPIWFKKLSRFELMVFGVGVLGIVICSYMLIKRFKKIEIPQKILMMVSVVSFVFWMLSAPLMRYGIVYGMLVFAIGFSVLFNKHMVGIIQLFIYFMLLVIINTFWQRGNIDPFPKVWQIDYVHCEAYANKWNGINIYIPSDGDTIGYHWFPSTPREDTLRKIELRGNSLEEGFRSK